MDPEHQARLLLHDLDEEPLVPLPELVLHLPHYLKAMPLVIDDDARVLHASREPPEDESNNRSEGV
jgi:hypothetical protein